MCINYPKRESDEYGYGYLKPRNLFRDNAIQLNLAMDRVLAGEL